MFFGGRGGYGGEGINGEATDGNGCERFGENEATVLVVTGDEDGGSEEQSVSVSRFEVSEQNRCDIKRKKK